MQISVKLPNGKVETQIFDSQLVTIGRSVKNDFSIQDDSLSRYHCQIELIDEEFYITDLGSANGVFLDGQKINPHEKVRFTTFVQLSIGPLDLQVADSPDEEPKGVVIKSGLKPSTPAINQEAIPTKAARKISTTALNKDTKDIKVRESKKQPASNKTGLFIAILLIVGGVAYQSMKPETKKATDKDETLSAEANVPAEFKAVKDDFLSASDYQTIEADKTCTGHEALCKQLKLSSDKSEGLVFKDKEVYVFLKPDEHLDLLSKKPELKEKLDFRDISAIDILLNSDLYSQFESKKLGQIHLILKTGEFRNYRVYRLHTKYFAVGERLALLNAVPNALETSDPKKFWDISSKIIKSRDL